MVTQKSNFKRVVVLLIKPSHWDSGGYVWRFRKGVLPSNTLQVMYGLTIQALTEILPPYVEKEVLMLEDGLADHANQMKNLAATFPCPGTKLVVCLVGVQTAQFPRACELIKFWQDHGATTIIGGGHVNCILNTLYYGIKDAMRPDIPCPGIIHPDLQNLIDSGVSLFHGEAEPSEQGNVWAQALDDLIFGKGEPIYDGGLHPLEAARQPLHEPSYSANFAGRIATIDLSRGCPFGCAFCAVINIQGRKMRCRDPQTAIAHIREIGEAEGRVTLFIVDDNFSRNRYWREILSGLSELRRTGLDVRFMIQADTQCVKVRDFFPMLEQAGCVQIFAGMESVNQANLAAVDKKQNHVDEYVELARACHEHGIIFSVGYILGLPCDTANSIPQDIEVVEKIGVDLANFFIYEPLPGSEVYVRAYVAGVPMDADWNRYDSFCAVWDPESMTRAEVETAYKKSWQRFYKARHMIASIRRFKSAPAKRNLLGIFLWYWWSIHAEQTHPMIAGLGRKRSYYDRRPSVPLPLWKHVLKEKVLRPFWYLGWAFAAFFVFQHVYFESLRPEESEKKTSKSFASWFQLARNTWNTLRGKALSRNWLNEFWIAYGKKKWQLLNPINLGWHIRMLPCAFAETILALRFVSPFFQIFRRVS